MEKKCCGFGKLSLNHIYILLTFLTFFLKSALLSLGEIKFQTNVNIFGFETVIRNHGLMKIIFEYLGYIIFGVIFFQKLEGSSFFKKIKKEKEKTKNKLLYQKKDEMTVGTLILVLIACGAFAIQLMVRSILSYCSVWMFDMWIFNIVFISIFMKKIFKKPLYRHQLLSLIIIFFVNAIILTTACVVRPNGQPSDYDLVNNLYGSYSYIALFYIVYLILSALICYSEVLQKQLMDFEYVSIFKILFGIGVVSTFFGLITLIIASNVRCNKMMIENKLCPITRPDYKDGAVYFDNFVIFLYNLGDQYKKNKAAFFIEIFIVYPLYSFSCYLKYFFETMVVYLFSPIYVLISDVIYYGTRVLITLIYNPSNTKNILNCIGQTVAFVGYCFYLEVIEINCCGLDFNTRTNINIRSLNESKADDDFEDDFEEDESYDIKDKKEDILLQKKEGEEMEMIKIKEQKEE